MGRAADAAKREAWRKRFERRRGSRCSLAEFCRRERVSVASFYYWQRQLERAPRSLAVSVPGPPAFVPVQLTAAAMVEIELPNRAAIRLPVQVLAGQWPQLIAAVGAIAVHGDPRSARGPLSGPKVSGGRTC